MPGAAETVTCAMCGRRSADPPATWMSENSARGRVWICPDCAREHLRAIEAKLDRQWW